MLKLLPVFIISLVAAGFSSAFSTYDAHDYNYSKRDRVFVFILIIALSIHAGMRGGYNDTPTYRANYIESLPITDPNFFSSINWSIGENPGFYLVSGVLRAMNFSAQSFLLIFAIITLSLYVWFIHKHTTNIFLSIFIFITMGGLSFVMSAMKQCFAIALSLIAIDSFLEEKKVRYVIFILIAITFHPYAILFFLCPLLTFKPWTEKTWILLTGFLLLGIFLPSALSRIVSITSLFGDEFTVSELTIGSVHPLRVLVYCVPIFISFFVVSKMPDEYTDRKNNLIVNLAMLNGAIMFIALFANPIYFGRLAEYFDVFYVLSIPLLIKFMDRRFKTIALISSVFLYTAYLIYSNVYQFKPYTYDDLYDGISFLDYLKNGIFGDFIWWQQ